MSPRPRSQAASPGSRYPVPRRSRGFPPASGGLLGL